MTFMKIKSLGLIITLSLTIFSCGSTGWLAPKTNVSWVGTLHSAGAKNDLTDNAFLSKLSDAKNLYAIGPVSQLDGEITVIDGKCFIARVDQNGGESVVEDCSQQAPFLVYGHFSKWNNVKSNVALTSMKDLKRRIMEILIENGVITEDPSAFLMEVDVEIMNYHIVTKNENIPLSIQNKKVTLLGFYSKHHAGSFTQKGEQLHIHFLSIDKKHSGHVNDFKLRPNSKWKMAVPTRF